MTLFVRPCLLLVLVLSHATANAQAIFERDWVQLQSANFTIHSTMSEADTRELAHYLEMFRVAVAVVTSITALDSPVPTNIIVLKHSADYDTLGLSPRTAGVFSAGMRENFVLLRDSRGDYERTTMLHEYVHQLVKHQGTAIYPRWFHEGLAEYLSTAEVSEDSIEVGLINTSYRYILNRYGQLSWSRVLSAQNLQNMSQIDTAQFYAQSWLLVHYLSNREDRNFGNDMATYMNLVTQGEEPKFAFEKAFDIAVGPLQRDLSQYIKRNFRMKSMELELSDSPEFAMTTTRPGAADVGLLVGNAALRFGKLVFARQAFERALESPETRARASAGIGDTFKFDDNYVAALPHFDRALELGADDPAVQLDIAEYWHNRAEKTPNSEKKTTWLKRARKHYVASWKLDDSRAETYAMLGETYTLLGDNHDRAVDMLQIADSILPSNASIQIMLANAYLAGGRYADAKQQALLVLSWAHVGSKTAKDAERVLTAAEARL